MFVVDSVVVGGEEGGAVERVLSSEAILKNPFENSFLKGDDQQRLKNRLPVPIVPLHNS